MKRMFLLLAAVASRFCFAMPLPGYEPPVVSDLTVKQRSGVGSPIDITCTVTGIDTSVDRHHYSLYCHALATSVHGLCIEVFLPVQHITCDGVPLEELKITNGVYHVVWEVKEDIGEDKYTSVWFTAGLRVKDEEAAVQLWEGGPYWATKNIGAEEPYDEGYYFWWGDTVGYKYEHNRWAASDGSDDNFLFTTNNAKIVTWNKSDEELLAAGIVDECGVLTSDYDAATVQWGNGWRMPSEDEVYTLCHGTLEWSDFGTVYEVYNKETGRAILLPTTGFAVDDGFNWDIPLQNLECGAYWSSHSLGSEEYLPYRHEVASGFVFYPEKDSIYACQSNRRKGCAIRPVRDTPVWRDVCASEGRTLDINGPAEIEILEIIVLAMVNVSITRRHNEPPSFGIVA